MNDLYNIDQNLLQYTTLASIDIDIGSKFKRKHIITQS